MYLPYWDNLYPKYFFIFICTHKGSVFLFWFDLEFFEAGFHCVVQTDLKLTILLP